MQVLINLSGKNFKNDNTWIISFILFYYRAQTHGLNSGSDTNHIALSLRCTGKAVFWFSAYPTASWPM